MLKPVKCLFSILFIILFSSPINSQKLAKRTPYKIPLIKLNIMDDKDNSVFKRIRISISSNKEYAIIAHLSDLHIKLTRQGKEKTTYAESPAHAYSITDFETQQLDRVISSLIATLTIFERDLAKQRWDKILYLDSFFPRFMKSFYYLSRAVINSHDALPSRAQVSESWFDVSLNSPKSDNRLSKWIDKKDYIIKLRIAARELTYQFKDWQKKELNKSKRNPELEYSETLKETYCLFVRMYFNQY